MKYFTLAIVLLAVCASVVLADKPSIKKRPVDPVPEPVEEDLEKDFPKKSLLSNLKQRPASDEKSSEEEQEKALPKKPLRPDVNKKPIADEEVVAEVEKKELSADLSEEVKEKNLPKKPLLGALKPKPTAEELGISAPEHIVNPEEPIENEPPSVEAKKKLPKPAQAKA